MTHNHPGLIARFLHGSHLYGLSHAESDMDYYQIVHDSFDGGMIAHGNNAVKAGQAFRLSPQRFGFARQTIDTFGEDSMTVSLRAFQRMIESGAPQAVEALMALRIDHENAHIADKRYHEYLLSLRPNPHTMTNSYRRTARNFGLGNGGRSIGEAGYAGIVDPEDIRKLEFKLARHGLRLMINLNEYLRYGLFNPELSAENIDIITDIAHERISTNEAARHNYQSTFTAFLESAMIGELKIQRYH